MTSKKNAESPLTDIIDFIQLPYSFQEPEEKRTYVIRIWLDVLQPAGEVLHVNGISRIDRIEYRAVGGEEKRTRERCLYREPAGRNVKWQFSPLYKLGKGSRNAKKALLGEDWKSDKNCRLNKLQQRVLNDFERTGFFSPGSVARIMDGLFSGVDLIAEYWSDKSHSYFLLFGIEQEGSFLYPGEVTAFIKYFSKKLNPTASAAKNKGKTSTTCAICGDLSSKVETLDKVFKFATFDKPGFLPGIRDSSKVREKVFPICPKCYALLSVGKETIDNRFVSLYIIPGMNLYVIPEIISDKQICYQNTAELTKEFLVKGIEQDREHFEILARQGEEMVFHFVFAEANQAQVIIHYLVEDVPPARLRELQNLWKETCTAFQKDDTNDHVEYKSLDRALREIVLVILSLGCKCEQDKTFLREQALLVVCALLNNNQINSSEIKKLMVNRFPSLFTDPDWIRPMEKGKMPGRIKLKGMAKVIDFLTRVNGRRKDESGLVSGIL